MLKHLTEAKEFWLEKLTFIKSCSRKDVARNMLVWLKIWKVPLMAWETRFFHQVGNLFGTTVCVAKETTERKCLQYGKVLVTTPTMEESV